MVLNLASGCQFLLLVLVLAIFITKSDSSDSSLEAVVIPIPTIQNTFSNFTQSTYDSKHNGSWIITDFSFSVVVPDNQKLQTTRRTAQDFNCDVGASNGGPFNGDGSSSGPLVIGGHHKHTDANFTEYVGFGTSTDGNWLIGNYFQFSDQSSIWSFVSGFHWLVYDSKSVVQEDTKVTRSARTAIGVNKENNLILLVVDGCEKCLSHRGMTLEELSLLLVENGARYAINLDGGGSSTMLYHYEEVNRPTCLDVPLVCERRVASVICLSSSNIERVTGDR